MKHLLTVILVFATPLVLFAQPKEEFQEKLSQERQKKAFMHQLLQLDSVFKNGADSIAFRSLATSGQYSYISFKTVAGHSVVVFDIIPLWAEAYSQMEGEGKINHLKQLRKEGKLRLTSRVIANEVQDLPKKTNASQSYNAFYIGVIKQLMVKYKSALAPDQLDFMTYQSWEKEANLSSETAIREYRETFILFLYSHYHLN
jgi:hypothetical protein